LLALLACSPDRGPDTPDSGEAPLGVESRIAVAEGFSTPESVRYDSIADVYFVSNYNGNAMEPDNNGFISRLTADGTIDSLRFIAGGRDGVTLHAPRGLVIVGDTLWASDIDAVRGFDRRTGAPLASVDLGGLTPGFTNDLAAAPDGTLYLTDSGGGRVIRIRGRVASVAFADRALGTPNGIAWDDRAARLLVVPDGGVRTIYGWSVDGRRLEPVGRGPGNYDGVVVLPDGGVLVSSKADSSLHLFARDSRRRLITGLGVPADIGFDPGRGRVAVPRFKDNRVELWAIERGSP
jgi:sugar lactone lactonase YvrE